MTYVPLYSIVFVVVHNSHLILTFLREGKVHHCALHLSSLQYHAQYLMHWSSVGMDSGAEFILECLLISLSLSFFVIELAMRLGWAHPYLCLRSSGIKVLHHVLYIVCLLSDF